MIINEILRFDKLNKPELLPCPSFDEGLQDTWNDVRNTLNSTELKSIPFNLKTRVFRHYSHQFVFAFEKDVPVIYVGLDEYYDGFCVDNVRVEPSVRGHHYGMKLYLAIAHYFNKPIYSGKQQTTASNNAIWKKLIELHPDRVVGFDQKTRFDLKLKATSRGPIVNGKEPIYRSLKSEKYNFRNTRKMAERTRLLKLLPR